MAMTTTVTPSNDTRPCIKCKGTGIHITRACQYCDGRGHFQPIDGTALMAQLITTRGGTIRLRTAAPKETRAYYVWRMARYHGNADPRMPFAAMIKIEGDPFQDELDQIATVLATAQFGVRS